MIYNVFSGLIIKDIHNEVHLRNQINHHVHLHKLVKVMWRQLYINQGLSILFELSTRSNPRSIRSIPIFWPSLSIYERRLSVYRSITSITVWHRRKYETHIKEIIHSFMHYSCWIIWLQYKKALSFWVVRDSWFGLCEINERSLAQCMIVHLFHSQTGIAAPKSDATEMWHGIIFIIIHYVREQIIKMLCN